MTSSQIALLANIIRGLHLTTDGLKKPQLLDLEHLRALKLIRTKAETFEGNYIAIHVRKRGRRVGEYLKLSG